MSDIVLVALISAGTTLAASVIAQFLTARASRRQAVHSAQQEALKWQRSEARRKEEQREARIREFWGQVLTTKARMLNLLYRMQNESLGRAILESDAQSPSIAAAEAHAIALIAFPEIRDTAKAFHLTTAELERSLVAGDHDAVVRATDAWNAALTVLENQVASLPFPK